MSLFIKRLLPLVIVAVVWFGLTGFDWFMRFERFRWQDGLIKRAVAPEQVRGPMEPMLDIMIPAQKGGDISRIAGNRSLVAEIEEWKPETPVVSDEYGYRNAPPTDDRDYPVTMVGDSFFHVQYGDAGSYAIQLEHALQANVYNHAFPGKGTFWGLYRFVTDGRFDHRPPRVVVWGILEREIGGGLFSSFPWRLQNAGQPVVVEDSVARAFDWAKLSPVKLKHDLPDSSFIALAGDRLARKVVTSVANDVHDDVIPSLASEQGQSFLFYRYSLDTLVWSRAEREPERVADAIRQLSEFLTRRGSKLMIVLIPEKGQVYRHLVPESERYQPGQWPQSTLYDLEAYLNQEKVPVINLLPLFEEAASGGTPLYWRDDTHWRPEAMRIAAQATAEVLRPLLNKEDSL